MRSPDPEPCGRPASPGNLASCCATRKNRQKKKEPPATSGVFVGHQMLPTLQPYQMVKDLRTELESGNPQSVAFDGDDTASSLASAGARTSRKLLRTERRPQQPGPVSPP